MPVRRLARAVGRRLLGPGRRPSVSVVVRPGVEQGRAARPGVPGSGGGAATTRDPARDVDLRLVRASTLEAAVLAADGDYLVFSDPADVVPPGAWAAMAASLEASGSDLVVGEGRTPDPRGWSAELFAEERRGTTAAACPVALVDLALTNKMFRLASWRRAGIRVADDAGGPDGPADALARDWSAVPGGVGCDAVLAAYLHADAFDVLPRAVCESPRRGAWLPLTEQSRFRADDLAVRLRRIERVAQQAPPGWSALAATHLLPPLYADAVGGGEAFAATLRAGAGRLLDAVEPAALPVAARLGAFVARHGTWSDQALLQDHLADHPHGLPVVDGLVPLPDGLSVRVPAAWRAVTDADRRGRTRVADRWASLGERAVLRGATFTEYVEEAPLPAVSLHVPGAAPVPLEVVPRADPRTNEWAARAWEDRTGAGWTAWLPDTGPSSGGLAGSVEVRAAGHVTRHRVEVRGTGRQPGCEVDAVRFEDGVLSVSGTTDRPRLGARVSGPRGSGPPVSLRVEGGRFAGRVPLTTTVLGQELRLPLGRYRLHLTADHDATGRWSPSLLDDPPELVDLRQRVTLDPAGPGLALHVRPPLRVGERGAFAQQTLRSRARSAPRAPSYDSTVVLETFGGRSVGDSPGAIARELLARDLGLDLVWVVDDPAVGVPSGTRAVHRRTEAWYDALALARVYVANASAPYWFSKKPWQVHLQTWHGTPLKRIGEDRGPGDLATWRHRRRVAEQAAGWDAMLLPNPYCADIFRSAFRFAGTFWETGYPRNDVLVNDDGSLRERVRRDLGVGPGELVVLYAPTWRSHAGVQQSKPLFLDVDLLTSARPDVVVLVRGHYSGTGEPEAFAGRARVRDVTRHPDIAELYLAADVLVTDYSSVMFDFSLTDRPIVLLTPDLEEYRDVERGFYFDLEAEAPGPLVRTTEEVLDVLGGADRDRARRAAFRERFCAWEDGRSAARAVDRLLDLW